MCHIPYLLSTRMSYWRILFLPVEYLRPDAMLYKTCTKTVSVMAEIRDSLIYSPYES